jgi:hypothetical protein
MLVKLYGGPHNGETVKVADRATEFLVFLEGRARAQVQAEEVPPMCLPPATGIYREGLRGSGNFYWIG